MMIARVFLSLGLCLGMTTAAAAGIPEPAQDPFYAPPAGYETTAPGTLLRSRSVTVTGLGIPIPVRAWQVLARSTDIKGNAVAVAATLMVPQTFYFGKRPLVSYQQAIDSLGDQCNPSYTLRVGIMQELPILSPALVNGWAVVVPDHEGPRNAYGAGRQHGYAVLDSIRAVEKLPGTGLAGTATPVGMWGYSGGGQATAWAGELQPSYAPELDIRGIASGGTPADIDMVLRHIDGGPFTGVVFAAVFGAAREYPELVPLFNAAGVAAAQQVADFCQAQLAVSLAFRKLSDFTTVNDPLSHPTVVSVLEDVKLGNHGQAPAAPLFLYHSLLDELIPVQAARDLKASYCAKGTKVHYYEDLLSEHIILAGTAQPLVVTFLAARFAGLPAQNDC